MESRKRDSTENPSDAKTDLFTATLCAQLGATRFHYEQIWACRAEVKPALPGRELRNRSGMKKGPVRPFCCIGECVGSVAAAATAAAAAFTTATAAAATTITTAAAAATVAAATTTAAEAAGARGTRFHRPCLVDDDAASAQ
jgi:hypothetical protein